MTFVYDQYDTDPTGAYSGSMSADVFLPKMDIFGTGNFRQVQIGNSAVRQIDLATLSQSIWLHSDLPLLLFTDFAKPPKWFSGQGFQRNSTFVCQEEQFADSVIGHPLNYTMANGITSSLVNPSGLGYADSRVHEKLGMLFAEPNSSVTLFWGKSRQFISRSDGPQEQFCDNIWNYTGPFQSRYKNVFKTKERNLSTPVRGTSLVSWSFGSVFTRRNAQNVTSSYGIVSSIGFALNSSFNGIPNETTFFADEVLSGVAGVYPAVYSGYSPSYISVPILYNCFFGFGDGPENSPSSRDSFAFNIYTTFSYVPIIRGYKYGLVSAMPKYSTMTFRKNRFGQPRDMLEQRQFSKIYDETGGFQNGPVAVSFKSGTVNYSRAIDYVTATNPTYNPRDSGIYDYEYKSGFPFVDIEPVD